MGCSAPTENLICLYITIPRFPSVLWKSKRTKAPSRATAVFLLVLGSLLPSVTYAQTATLRGFISDQSNGEALPGANVYLRDASGDLFGAAADNDGFFAVGRLVPGTYVVVVSFIGFVSHADTLQFARDEVHS